jgi:2'-5' RNA ligase
MARAFVAIVPPPDALTGVGTLSATSRERVDGGRWTTAEQWHLTLQFLGNHADLDVCAGALASLAIAPGNVALGGVGAFPTARRARVLWVGVRAGAAWLAQASAAVGALLRPVGHAPEEREFHPHVTLARFRTPTDVRPVIDAATAGDGAIGPMVGEAFEVTEVVLFESTARAYRAHSRLRLGAPLDPG